MKRIVERCIDEEQKQGAPLPSRNLVMSLIIETHLAAFYGAYSLILHALLRRYCDDFILLTQNTQVR